MDELKLEYKRKFKILYIILSSFILLFVFLPFVIVTSKNQTSYIGFIHTVLLDLSGFTSKTSILFTILFYIVSIGGGLSTIVFSILNIVINASKLKDGSADVDNRFTYLSVSSYLIMTTGTILIVSGLGKYGNYYSRLSILFIFSLIALLVFGIIICVLKKRMYRNDYLEVSGTYFHRIMSIVFEIASILLLSTDLFGDDNVGFFQAFLIEFFKNSFYLEIAIAGLIVFIFSALGIIFKTKYFLTRSRGFQSLLSFIQAVGAILLCIFIQQYRGYIVLVANWTVIVLAVISCIKLLIDLFIGFIVGE